MRLADSLDCVGSDVEVVVIAGGRLVADGRGCRLGSRRRRCRVPGGCRRWIAGGGGLVGRRRARRVERVWCWRGCGSAGRTVGVGLGRRRRRVRGRFAVGFETVEGGLLDVLKVYIELNLTAETYRADRLHSTWRVLAEGALAEGIPHPRRNHMEPGLLGRIETAEVATWMLPAVIHSLVEP